jgi:peptide chain release factor 1
MSLFPKLEEVEKRFEDISSRLSDASLLSNQKEYNKVSKEFSDLKPVVEKFRELKKISQELDESYELSKADDEEIAAMAKAEVQTLTEQKELLEGELQFMLLPKDPNDGKNAIMEIRAGTGGDEASLFAAHVMRMYLRYAEKQKWKVEMLSQSESDMRGIKEAIFLIEGHDVFSKLKFEGGVHRVQRVPATEANGRIHTSAITVVVMPEAEDIDVKIEDKDLRIDVMRSGGSGGQSVNTTDSAVRITHAPSGLVVICQDEKSQLKNKVQAMKVLRARLYEIEVQKQQAALTSTRRSMVGSGDRSERIRTYNFPQNRLTDHRINLTLHKLDQVMEGHLDEVITALRTHHQAELLQSGQ